MDIQAIILDLIPVLVPAIVGYLVILCKYILARLPENQHAIVTQVAQSVVNAVEQVYGPAAGTDKKTIAENRILDILKAMHITISPTLIDVAIEAAVYALKQDTKDAGPSPVAPVASAAKAA